MNERVAELYKKDVRAVRSVIMEIVQDHNDVDELVQDTFVRVTEKIDLWDEEQSTLLTWVCNVAKSVAKNWLRDQNTDPDLVLESNMSLVGEEGAETYDAVYEAADPSDQPELCEEADDLLTEACTRMPEQMAACVKLRYEGYSNDEIAEELGTSNGNVRKQISNSSSYFD